MAIGGERKKEISGISFARAVLTLYIVLIHFVGGTGRQYAILDRYIYAPWNSMSVAGFFLISGAVMYYNHREIPSVGRFYFKRLKSLLPAFYLAYSFFFVQQAFEKGDVLPHGQPWCLVFSLLGMDGYFEFKVPNYYLIGEWFLGAILILYLLYPLLLKATEKSPAVTAVFVFGMYYVMLKTMFFTEYSMRNIFTCLMSFFTGMMIIRYRELFLGSRWIGIASLLFLVTSGRFFILPIDPCTVTQINGYALFFVLFYLGEMLMKAGPVRRAVTGINRIGYPVFLVHHIIVDKVNGYRIPENSLEFAVLFLISLALTFALAKALAVVTDAVLKSSAWSRFEKRILKQE